MIFSNLQLDKTQSASYDKTSNGLTLRMVGLITPKGMKSENFLPLQCHCRSALPQCCLDYASFSTFSDSFPQVMGNLEGTDMIVDAPSHLPTSKVLACGKLAGRKSIKKWCTFRHSIYTHTVLAIQSLALHLHLAIHSQSLAPFPLTTYLLEWKGKMKQGKEEKKERMNKEKEEGREKISDTHCQLHIRKLDREAARKSEFTPAPTNFLLIHSHTVSLFR